MKERMGGVRGKCERGWAWKGENGREWTRSSQEWSVDGLATHVNGQAPLTNVPTRDMGQDRPLSTLRAGPWFEDLFSPLGLAKPLRQHGSVCQLSLLPGDRQSSRRRHVSLSASRAGRGSLGGRGGLQKASCRPLEGQESGWPWRRAAPRLWVFGMVWWTRSK